MPGQGGVLIRFAGCQIIRRLSKPSQRHRVGGVAGRGADMHSSPARAPSRYGGSGGAISASPRLAHLPDGRRHRRRGSVDQTPASQPHSPILRDCCPRRLVSCLQLSAPSRRAPLATLAMTTPRCAHPRQSTARTMCSANEDTCELQVSPPEPRPALLTGRRRILSTARARARRASERQSHAASMCLLRYVCDSAVAWPSARVSFHPKSSRKTARNNEATPAK